MRLNRNAVYFAILALACSIIVSIGSIRYANMVGQKAERQSNASNAKTELEVHDFCRLIDVLDTAYQATPPQTQTGRNLAVAVHELRVSLNC